MTEQNVTPVGGGEVHLPHPAFENWPLCRTYGSNRVQTRFRPTDAAVTCAHCLEQLRRREIAARRAAEEAEVPRAAALQAVGEAGLTAEGFHFLLGALVRAAPHAVEPALATLRRRAAEPGQAIRYFRDGA
ncbi:hypothetical protein [Actinomadura opuntiae]|uniref:hypothetical protein n=1 Tax=Actinomadura sp. OS1-43 TaxID=604315 RepID=UPI00255ABA4C|nr:hypothetical protein [Actinomadura sp. OS1-43]MDL4812765.1 hypothetical protein [Actinomadura sp. OS1-43]